jgi:hypothetical protein
MASTLAVVTDAVDTPASTTLNAKEAEQAEARNIRSRRFLQEEVHTAKQVEVRNLRNPFLSQEDLTMSMGTESPSAKPTTAKPSKSPTTLPPCPKCDYKDCYDKVEKAFIVDSTNWDTVRDAWLKATDDWKNDQIRNCELKFGIGSLASDACALGVNTVAGAQDKNTWISYTAGQSVLRTKRNLALSDCDTKYYECVKNRVALIAAGRCK